MLLAISSENAHCHPCTILNISSPHTTLNVMSGTLGLHGLQIRNVSQGRPVSEEC